VASINHTSPKGQSFDILGCDCASEEASVNNASPGGHSATPHGRSVDQLSTEGRSPNLLNGSDYPSDLVIPPTTNDERRRLRAYFAKKREQGRGPVSSRNLLLNDIQRKKRVLKKILKEAIKLYDLEKAHHEPEVLDVSLDLRHFHGHRLWGEPIRLL
jgi:hypothetical protein